MGRGEYIILIIDGHGSYCTMKFYKYCVEAKIIFYCLPSHITHHLQPLDVVIFSLFINAYRKKVREHSKYAHLKISKTEFLRYLQPARDETLIKSNFKAAFAAAGLIP
jgi:hypothetical protein